MLYLCEKFGQLGSLERYDPAKDISVTGAYTDFIVKRLEQEETGFRILSAVNQHIYKIAVSNVQTI